MKVVLINGSPRANGNTARALKEVAGTLGAEGIETETVWTGNKPVRGCMACYQCKAKNLGKCVFGDDAANTIIEKLKDADGIVVGAHLLRGRGIRQGKARRIRRGVPARGLDGGLPVHEHAL